MDPLEAEFEGRKDVFFEKKTPKTFVIWYAPRGS
jgi:hypothetical protein